jgi:hypothetical protein
LLDIVRQIQFHELSGAIENREKTSELKDASPIADSPKNCPLLLTFSLKADQFQPESGGAP